MKKATNMWEYKVGINVNIANFVCLWKPQLSTNCDIDGLK